MVDIMDKIDTVGRHLKKILLMLKAVVWVGLGRIWEDDKRNTKDIKDDRKDQKRNSVLL